MNQRGRITQSRRKEILWQTGAQSQIRHSEVVLVLRHLTLLGILGDVQHLRSLLRLARNPMGDDHALNLNSSKYLIHLSYVTVTWWTGSWKHHGP